jgi:hypothetical protein
MDMKKYLLMLAFTLPLMAQETQEVEIIKKDGKTIVKVDGKEQHSGRMKRMNRSDEHKMMGKRMAMAKRKKMNKKRAIRSVVRLVVIGGVAYYVGYHQGEKHFKGGMGMKRRMGDKK